MSTLRPDEKDHRIALLLAKVKEMEAERDRLAAELAEAKLEAKEACDLWEGAKKAADTLRTELAEARRERDTALKRIEGLQAIIKIKDESMDKVFEMWRGTTR